jgi:hypothetical protein
MRELNLARDVDKYPDPHPALRATFSRWEKENAKHGQIHARFALQAPLPTEEGLG